jgi:hypothetical protein
MAAVPCEAHDVQMNFVVTESLLYDGKNEWSEVINAPAEMIAKRG